MTLAQAIAYGLVQGLGEFLPISSSAHLVILPWATGWADPGLAFDVALHLGTLVAVLAYFRRDLWRLGLALLASLRHRSLGGDVDRRLAWLIVVGCVPGGVAGVLLKHLAEERLRGAPLIAGTMIGMGLLLWLADRLGRQERKLDGLGWRDALLIGLAQAAAIVPGVSRSGSTITAARALGLDRDAAARFSFLLAVPIVLGAGLVEIPALLRDIRMGGVSAGALAVGLAVAAVSGYAAIAFLLGLVRRSSYLPFVVYRVLFGLALIATIACGVRR